VIGKRINGGMGHNDYMDEIVLREIFMNIDLK